jgi:hypothetical protein
MSDGKRHLSLKERIVHAVSSQSAEQLHAKHTYLHARTDGTTEYDTMWAKTKDSSWAHAFGRMRGFDQVWFGNVNSYDAMAMQGYLAMYETYPEVGGKDPRPLMEASVHTLTNDVVEVAADGQSVRASFITPGVISSVLTPLSHRYCNVLWERYGADFVYVDGELKYLHEHVCPDILTRLDNEDWAMKDYERTVDPSAGEAPPATLGTPPVTDPGPLHQPYTLLSLPQDTVPWPEPYETLDNDNTYTPFL